MTGRWVILLKAGRGPEEADPRDHACLTSNTIKRLIGLSGANDPS